MRILPSYRALGNIFRTDDDISIRTRKDARRIAPSNHNTNFSTNKLIKKGVNIISTELNDFRNRSAQSRTMTIDSVNSKTSKLRSKQVSNNASPRMTNRESNNVMTISQSSPKYGTEKPSLNRSKTNATFHGRGLTKKSTETLGLDKSKTRAGRRSSLVDPYNSIQITNLVNGATVSSTFPKRRSSLSIADESNILLPRLRNGSTDNPFFDDKAGSFPQNCDNGEYNASNGSARKSRKGTLSPAPPGGTNGPIPSSALEIKMNSGLGKMTDLKGKTCQRVNSPSSLRMSVDLDPIRSGNGPELSKNFLCPRSGNTRHSCGDLGIPKWSGRSHHTGPLGSESNDSYNPLTQFNLSAVKPRKLSTKMRAVSVYSPSSFESSEISACRPPRYNPRRRASVPAIALTCEKQLSESLRSPEFSKAFKELNGTTSPQGSSTVTRSETNLQRSLQAASETTIEEKDLLTGPIPKRDALDCIEEIIPESLFPQEEIRAIFSDESIQIESGVNKLTLSNKDEKQKRAKVGNTQEFSKSVVKYTKGIVNGSSQSPLSSINSKKRPAKQETNNDFREIVLNNQTTATEIIHLDEDMNDANDDKTIDLTILDESDDAICEEDYHRKRIILWLMKVQTGDNAEQVTREQTPASSPKLNHGNAIVVVYDENK